MVIQSGTRRANMLGVLDADRLFASSMRKLAVGPHLTVAVSGEEIFSRDGTSSDRVLDGWSREASGEFYGLSWHTKVSATSANTC